MNIARGVAQEWMVRVMSEEYIKKKDAARKGEMMKISYQCSNCGQKFQVRAMVGVPDGMYISGCRAVGDAFYCEDCVKTWADRNGKPFDEQYAMPAKMFTRWWNNMVDEQARLESKTDKVKVFKVINGVYVEG